MSTFLGLGAGGRPGHVSDWSRRLLDEAAARNDTIVIADSALLKFLDNFILKI